MMQINRTIKKHGINSSGEENEHISELHEVNWAKTYA